MKKYVNLFHILFVGTLFLYVGIYQKQIKHSLYMFLIFLGLFVFIYHSFIILHKIKSGNQIWINLIHIFVVAPLLLIIGFNKEETPRKYFEMLLMLGMAVIGYHTYYLFFE
jgi:hypothetical protein